MIGPHTSCSQSSNEKAAYLAIVCFFGEEAFSFTGGGSSSQGLFGCVLRLKMCCYYAPISGERGSRVVEEKFRRVGFF